MAYVVIQYTFLEGGGGGEIKLYTIITITIFRYWYMDWDEWTIEFTLYILSNRKPYLMNALNDMNVFSSVCISYYALYLIWNFEFTYI